MLVVENICKSFGKTKVLNNVDFTLDCGECICLIGTNGSGKSTLLSIIAGAVKQDKGRVYNTDTNLIGYVPQDNILFEELTVMDNLKFWYAAYGLDKKNIFSKNSIESILNLEEFAMKKVKVISGGMKKRVSIAVSLCHNPNYLVLDEPCSSLDLIYRNEIIQYLSLLKSMGIGIIFSSHSSVEIKSLCDKLVVLKSNNAYVVFEEPEIIFKDALNLEQSLIGLIKG